MSGSLFRRIDQWWLIETYFTIKFTTRSNQVSFERKEHLQIAQQSFWI